MTQMICPRCNQRIITDPNCEDFEHQCNSGNKTLDNEDIIKLGKWTDYTGSGTSQNVFLQGAENTLFGTRADIEGEDNEEKTRRGLRSSTRRTRQHIEHIDLKGGDYE